MSKKYYSQSEKKALFRKLALIVAVFAVVIAFIVLVLGKVDDLVGKDADTDYSDEDDIYEEAEDVVELNGTLYVPKKNIETYLFMGVDADGKVKKAEDYGQSGQCDVIMVLVRDLSKATYQTLVIDRNTMCEVKSLDLDGSYLATTTNQIALAHADGDGLEISCENVVDAVSNLLHGQKIDGYAALNMGAIGTINNLVGGVTVTIEDDFSQADPSLKMGETITLTDEQAVTYVRGRMNVGDGTNENRMHRQSEYMKALQPMITKMCTEDSSFP